jgi:hypothetical protein
MDKKFEKVICPQVKPGRFLMNGRQIYAKFNNEPNWGTLTINEEGVWLTNKDINEKKLIKVNSFSEIFKQLFAHLNESNINKVSDIIYDTIKIDGESIHEIEQAVNRRNQSPELLLLVQSMNSFNALNMCF